MNVETNKQSQQSCQSNQEDQEAGNQKSCASLAPLIEPAGSQGEGGTTEKQGSKNGFKDRIIRAAKLDTSLYKEVAADAGTMNQAIFIVLLSAVAAGVGKVEIRGPGLIFIEPISAVIGWYMWTYLTYLVGTRLLLPEEVPEGGIKSSPGELLRTIGFSHAPGMIRVISIVPGIFNTMYVLGSSWMLVAMVVAVKQTFNYKSTSRVLWVCAISWIMKTLVFITFAYLVGSPPPKPI